MMRMIRMETMMAMTTRETTTAAAMVGSTACGRKGGREGERRG